MYVIDKKDRRILTILNNNCRKSNTKIAKEVGLSRDSVIYRIHKLEDEGIIHKYTVDINHDKIGFVAFSVAIKLQNITPETEEKIITFLVKNKKITFLEKTLSKYDLAFILLIKSIEEVNKEISIIRKFIGKNLKHIDMGISTDNYEFSTSLFDYEEQLEKKNENKEYVLDQQDKLILSELSKNSRMSAVNISKKTGLSVFLIANKIKKLIKNNIIYRFKAILNVKELSYHKYTLLLNIYNLDIETQIIEFCKIHKQIWGLDKSLSNYNYAIEIYAKNNEEFEIIVKEIMNLFSKNILDYETLIVLKELKYEYCVL